MSERTPLTGRGSDFDDDSAKKKRNIIIIGIIIFLIVAVTLAITLSLVLKKKHTNDPHKDALKQKLQGLSSSLSPQSERLQEFWNSYGNDSLAPNLGFYGTIAQNGTSIEPNTKTLLQISQHLWSYATLTHLGQANALALSNNLYEFLTFAFYQVGAEDFGQFYYMVDRTGSNILDDNYHLYAEAFTLLGIGQYYRYNQNDRVKQYFQELFDDMDYHARDNEFGGFNSTYDPQGNAYPDPIAKDVYSHLALLEALALLYELDPTDENVAPRMLEIYNIFAEKMIQPNHYIHQYYTLNWTLVGGPVQNYGVDLETVWVYARVADALGFTNDTQIILQVGAAASEAGFDSVNGGYFYEGVPAGDVTDNTKVYWTQASSLLGNWEMFLQTNDQVYLNRMESTIDYINKHQADPEYGEWFEAIDGNGTISSTNKGTHTKSSFHPIRATFYLQKQIDQYISNNL